MIFAGIALVVCGLSLIVFTIFVLYAEEDREWIDVPYQRCSRSPSAQYQSDCSSSSRELQAYESTVEIVVLDERRERS